MPLTDTEIRNRQPGPKPVRLFDGGGLYLEVAPAGGKWWRLKYRYLGKEKRLSLGVYPETPLKEARKRCLEAKDQLAQGVDPAIARKAGKARLQADAASTFEIAATAWLKHRSPGWKAVTHDRIKAALETHVYPRIGAMPLADMKPGQVRSVVQAIEKTGARETAARTFQWIRAVFRYAIQHELCELDPTYSLKAEEIFKPHKVTHRAALREREVPEFLQKLDEYDGEASTRAALRLLMLTAVRPGELRGALWSEIDFDRALWEIDGPRMKMDADHVVPLSRQALALLKEVHELGGHRELVFPSPFYPGKSLSENTFNSALARMGYKGFATAHGFRTLFSTAANESGLWSKDAIEKQLAHEERNQVRASYNRAQYLPERTRLMQWWADRVDELSSGGKVLPFRAA